VVRDNRDVVIVVVDVVVGVDVDESHGRDGSDGSDGKGWKIDGSEHAEIFGRKTYQVFRHLSACSGIFDMPSENKRQEFTREILVSGIAELVFRRSPENL
jgi:hypothetical protein